MFEAGPAGGVAIVGKDCRVVVIGAKFMDGRRAKRVTKRVALVD